MKKIILITILAVSLVSLFSIFDDYGPSARARALGGAFYSISDDADAVFYNPSGLEYAHNEVIISYTDLWNTGYNELKNIAVSYKMGKAGTIGLGVQMFDVTFEDVTLQSEQTYSINHAFTLFKDIHSEATIGYGVNIYRLSFDEQDTKATFGLNIGAMATLRQRTRLGFSVSNLNNPKIGAESKDDLPQLMAIGLSYIPYEMVTTSIEMKQEFGGETSFMSGLEITPVKALTLRAGVHNKPNVITFGAGINMFNVLVDYAYNSHVALNGTHHIAIGYKF
ncbi:MAG: hypothetical protein JXR56_05630 [Candidatus Cloacimonetes bacterium]|nr:hypothetical protein [Candidatus Cloacimonadota bacterium]